MPRRHSRLAGSRAGARKLGGSKIVRSIQLREHVEDRVAMGWSPKQIAGRMTLEKGTT
ncbi:MAG: hypothetical protein AAGA32_21785 [Pseudomonadota bacterium]